MKKEIVVAVFMSVFLLLSILVARLVIPISASTTYHVYPGQSIQEAINSVQPGDTIFVHNGTYIEDVVVNKSISLIGENKKTTIIYGSRKGTVVYVSAHNVNISRFTIKNSSNLGIHGGIFLNNLQGCRIDGNEIDVLGSGIILSGGSENHVINNNIGPQYSWYGIYLINSNGNTIAGNVQRTSDVGIKLIEGSCGNNISNNFLAHNICQNIALHWGCDNNSITNNKLGPGVVSIWVDDSDGNVISLNNFGGCLQYFISLWGSEGTAVYHNNFFSSSKVDILDSANNVWDDNYPSGGNYWSAHNPPDLYSGPYQNETGSDGIGDIPYIIKESNIDNYPLIYPYGYVPSPDVNDDGIVDIVDIVTCALAFGTKVGDPKWDALVDLNQDGIVDIVDIVMVAIHFGETYP